MYLIATVPVDTNNWKSVLNVFEDEEIIIILNFAIRNVILDFLNIIKTHFHSLGDTKGYQIVRYIDWFF